MEPDARRHAGVEYRVKLSRETGTTLTATDCEKLLHTSERVSGGDEQVSPQNNPGLVYACLGEAIAYPMLTLVLQNH